MFDVIVIGYGPTGLVLAATLGRAGHRVAVVERWLTLYGLPRLSHIDDEGARVIQAVADADKALRDSAPIPCFTFLNAAGETLTTIGSDGKGTQGYACDISIYQPDIESAIDDSVRSMPNVEMFLGHQLVGLRPSDAVVEIDIAPVSNRAALTQLQARFLVGCDGARSFVRDALHIGRHDFGFNERWLNIDTLPLRPPPAHLMQTVQYCDPQRGHMHLPIGTKRLRFELALFPEETTERMQRPEEAWRWLKMQHDLGPEDVSIIRQVVYTFESRIAERWRQGPVFLAGDAAHTMPPYMGQGACSGMRDGLNLGWKLGLVLNGLADPAMLDTYETERKPHVTAITMMSIKLGEIANEHDPVRAQIRDEALKHHQPPKPKLPKINAGLLDPLKSRLSGELWPQGQVKFRGRTGLFDDVVGHGFCLLSRDASTASLTNGQTAALGKLGCHVIDLAELEDIEGTYTRLLRDNDLALLLARPDFLIFGTAASAADGSKLVDALFDGLGRPLQDRAGTAS